MLAKYSPEKENNQYIINFRVVQLIDTHSHLFVKEFDETENAEEEEENIDDEVHLGNEVEMATVAEQMLTFFRWNKRKYKSSTVFNKLSWKMRGLLLVACTAAVLVLNVVLGRLGSEYIVLDNVTNVIGIVNYGLTFLSFVEYPILQIAGLLLGSVNYIVMVTDGNSVIVPHLIYNAYCFVCIVKATISVYRLYREQQGSKQVTEVE